MTKTYKAVQVSEPGKLKLVELPIREPRPGQVRLRIEACGVCHSVLCAGLTTFNALRKAGLRAGALVAIQGVGGLGHLGIQFARRMGFKTIALNRGTEN